ncbi:hypothetical protein ACJQWK_05412 [Exserohilum turcicum]
MANRIMYRSYWIPEMNDTPPNKLGRLTAWRGQAFPIGGLMRWSLDLPPERLKNAMEGKMRMSAERYSMDQRDFKAVKQTIDAAVKYFKDGKSLNFTSIKVDELDSLWPDGVTAMEQLTDLVHCEDDTKVRRRFYQAFGIEILEKALKQKGNGNPTARDIEQLLGTDKYKALRDTISTQQIVAIFGAYMENIQHFPFVPEKTPMSARLKEFFKVTNFPGSKDEWFTISQTHWHSFEEARNYTRTIGFSEHIENTDDEEILRINSLYGRELQYHNLLCVKHESMEFLTVATAITPGTILGIIPNEHRYPHPRQPERHWLRLPKGVYCEPLPSPFTLLFQREVSESSPGNISLGYDRIRDPFTGVAPTYRLFAVATEPIAPLEPLIIC